MSENEEVVFSLHFSQIQNESFYTSKWPILVFKMSHFDEHNGPFCDAK